jgi:Dolichyl-phosphate-mannose-protein mannosyltransferase
VQATIKSPANLEIPERDIRRMHAAIALSVILISALFVRLAGIRFGLPFALARPDEVTLVHAALNIGDKGFSPHYFNYPSLYPSILAAAYFVYSILRGTTRRPGEFAGLAHQFAVDPTHLLLIDRIISACLGVATVWLVYAIGKRIAGRAVGLLSALFLSLAYLHARESHFGTVDVPMTFFATLALLVALKGYQDGRRSSFLLAGLCAGLAASTKYNAVAVVASVGLAYVLRRLENRPAEDPSSTSATESGHDLHTQNAPTPVGEMLALALSVPVGFLIGTPYILWDWRQFMRDSQMEIRTKMTRGPWVNLDLGTGWIYHLKYSLPHGVGWPMLIAAAIGAAIALRKAPKPALVLLAFPFFWWLGVGKSHAVFVRYALPMVPPICVMAAVGVEQIGRWMPRIPTPSGTPARQRAASLVITALALLVIAVPAYRIACFDRILCRTDSRLLTGGLIEQTIPPGATVGVCGYQAGWPLLWNTADQLQAAIGNANPKIASDDEVRTRLDFVRSHDLRTYHLEQYNPGLDGFQDALTTRPVGPPPDYVIVVSSPLAAYGNMSDDLQADLNRNYVQIGRINALATPIPAEHYDQHDAFYLPYTSMDGVIRPGPEFDIYRRSDLPTSSASTAPAASAPATK